MRTVLVVGAVFGTLLVVQLAAEDSHSRPAQPSFPDTEVLVSHVAEHQKDVEALFSQYTFTDKTTVYTVDKTGAVKSQHTDIYYITPTPYEVFALHISHDGKPTSQEILGSKRKTSSTSCKTTNARLKKIQVLVPKTLFCSPTSLASLSSRRCGGTAWTAFR